MPAAKGRQGKDLRTGAVAGPELDIIVGRQTAERQAATRRPFAGARLWLTNDSEVVVMARGAMSVVPARRFFAGVKTFVAFGAWIG